MSGHQDYVRITDADGHGLSITIDPPPDELQFVDADIAEAFRGTMTLQGTASMVQLARTIRELTEAVRAMPKPLVHDERCIRFSGLRGSM